jgi:integrase
MGAYRDKQGKWHYRKWFTLGDGNGIRIRGTPVLNTKVAAEQAERDHIARALKGERDQPVPPRTPTTRKEDAGTITLSKFVNDIWWPKFRTGGGRRGVNSYTTLMEKESHLRVHILPALGELGLANVSNEALTEFFGQLREHGYQKKGRVAKSTKSKAVQKREERAEGRKDRGKARRGLSEKSIKNVRTTLHTLLGFAVRWGYLSRIPELPEVVVPESGYDWYQLREVRQLLAAARDDWARTVLLFALHTGVRMGEQRAVRWSDIDFESRIITIRRSAPKWLSIEKNPKSNRHRRVDLTPELGVALKDIRHGGEIVFCNDDGSKLQPGQFHEILWAAQKKAGLRRIKWHELRHSYASILTTGGAPLRVVQSLLGHSSIKMTERYAHLAPGQSGAFMHLLADSVSTPPNSGQPSGQSSLETGPN